MNSFFRRKETLAFVNYLTSTLGVPVSVKTQSTHRRMEKPNVLTGGVRRTGLSCRSVFSRCDMSLENEVPRLSPCIRLGSCQM